MSRPSISALVACSLIVPVLAQAGDAPIAAFTPLAPDTYIDVTVIDRDFAGNAIGEIHSAELRPIGAGLYRVALCVQAIDPVTLVQFTWTDLLTGVLDMTQPPAPAAWTPDNHMLLVNSPGTTISNFQLSLSDDGLVAVWDCYTVTTYNTPAGPQSGNTFVCRRANTAAQFAVADVRVVQNISGGGVDPHVTRAKPNGRYGFSAIDFTVSNGSLDYMELDPATGQVFGTTRILDRNGGAGFCHSQRVFEDSTGRPRCIVYSDYPGSGGYSNWMFTAGTTAVLNSATPNQPEPEMLILGSSSGPLAATSWLNNPGIVGGRMSVCTDGSNGQHVIEGTFIANTTLALNAAQTSYSGIIPAWAPTAPAASAPRYWSWVGVGFESPIAIPIPILNAGDLHITPDVVLGIIFHNTESGAGEFAVNVNNIPNLGPISWWVQLATLDTQTSALNLSNTARLVKP